MKFRQLVDQATMQAIDAEATTRAGITALSLMEAAADCAAGLACSLVSGPSAKVLILAGPGNNGADGLAVGRLLVKAGYHPDLYSVVGRSGRTSELWQEQARRLASAGRAIFPFETSLKGSWDLIIDALAGVGQKGPLEGPVVQAVDWIKGWTEVAGQAQVLSLDLPSGLYDAWQDGQPAVRANHTMCFGLPKLCLYTARARHLAGQIVIADIGIPAGIAMPADAPELLLHEDLAALVPPVGPDSHKFDRGSPVIVAGSRQYPGALELAARAALNSRAGMVHVVAAETVFNRLPGLPPELLRHELSEADQSSLESDWLPARTDALCVGPGWGRDPDRPDRLRSLFGRCLQGRIPLVVDADGLDALRQTGPLAHAGLILTPHAGELAKLADCSSDALAGDPQPILVQVARRFQATVLLKGPVTWIVSPDSKISVYDGANPLLAQAGSGDILAGIMVAVLSGLVRQGLDGHAACLRAAQIACLVLAAAGRQAITSLGWASSSGVLTALPRVWADLSAPGLRGSSNWGGESMIQSVAGVLIRDGRILLARRKSGGDMGGRWELPGGKCEGMEGPVAALIREFDEEFSLMIMVGPACAETVFRHHGKDHQVRAYRIETEGSFDKLAEHDEVAWFSLKNLPPRPTIVDSDAELLDQLAGHGR